MISRQLGLRVAAAALTVGFGSLACDPIGGGSGASCATAPNDPIPALTLAVRYTAASISGLVLPAKTIDANGDSIRVYADTLYFSNGDSTYTEATQVGRFVGTTETVTVERIVGKKYSRTANSATLPQHIGGYANVTSGATTLTVAVSRPLVMGTRYWYYDPR